MTHEVQDGSEKISDAAKKISNKVRNWSFNEIHHVSFKSELSIKSIILFNVSEGFQYLRCDTEANLYLKKWQLKMYRFFFFLWNVSQQNC